MFTQSRSKRKGNLTGLIGGLAMLAGFSTIPHLAYSQDVNDGYYITASESSFENAVTDVENAIVNKGLVIDYTGKVGDMLARTGDTVGMQTPFKDAVYMQFCSAKHTHEVVAANPFNIAVCPYVVFIYEMADGSGAKIGYRRPVGAEGAASAQAIAGIDAMLKQIVNEAAEGL